MYLNFASQGMTASTMVDEKADLTAMTRETPSHPEAVAATLLYAATGKQMLETSFFLRTGYEKTFSQTINAHGGLILHVQHNRVAALFGLNGQADHTYQAVQAALALLDQITAVNKQRKAIGSSSLRLGIGLSSGLVNLQHQAAGLQFANKGSLQVFETARQLSGLNEQTPFPSVFINQETLAGLSTTPNWHVESLGPVWLSGNPQPQMIHAIMPPLHLP